MLFFNALQLVKEMQVLLDGIEFFLATPVAVGVNVSILILALVAVRNLAQAHDRLERDEAALERLTEVSADPDEIETLLADEVFADTLAEGRVRALQAGVRSQNLELLSASDSEELHQEVSLARGIAGAVVLLGLAGTLVGLSLGVGPLIDVLQIGTPDPQALWDAMNDSVSGLATAFSTTLSGVLGALVLGGALTRYEGKAGRFLVALERTTLSVLLPAYSSGDPADFATAVEKLDQVRQSFEENFLHLTKQVEERGENLSREVVTGFDDATAELVRGFKKMIGPFEQVRDATLRLVGEPEEDAESLADQVDRLGEAATQLERSVESVEALIPELRDTLVTTFRQQSEATRESLEGHYRRMAERVSDQAESTRRLSEEVQKSSESVATVVDSLDDFSSAVEDYKQTWAQVASSVRSAERTLDTRLTAMNQSVEETFKGLIDQQANVQQRVLNSLAQFETQLTDAIEAVERERRRSVSRSEELIRELRDAVKDAVREIDVRSQEQQELVSRAIREGIENLKLELRDVLAPTGTPRSARSDSRGGGRSAAAASPADPTVTVESAPEGGASLEDIFGGEEEDASQNGPGNGSEGSGRDR